MNAVGQLVAELVTALVLIALVSLAATEYVGARVPGFHTISDTARAYAAEGDYLLVLLGGCWWAIHILWRI
jgi:hypothetical protein